MSKRAGSADTGYCGETMVQLFFDRNLSPHYCFPHARTKSNAQVADLFVWMNRVVLLVEVKTRRGGVGTPTWASSAVQNGAGQIRDNAKRLRGQEEIFLRNDHYDVRFDFEGISLVMGLVVLVCDPEEGILPTVALADVYSEDPPVQVLTSGDLEDLSKEIDTMPDLIYYLTDRLSLVRRQDIPLGVELGVLGIYKSGDNQFPLSIAGLLNGSSWTDYRTSRRQEIALRDEENRESAWVDAIASRICSRKRQHDRLPVGLYLAWELCSLPRRGRAIIGQKIASLERAFAGRRSRRYFAFENPITGNWLVFLFSTANEDHIHDELRELVELKATKEIQLDDFQNAVYGFAIQVSQTWPRRPLSICSVMFITADEVNKRYSSVQQVRAREVWGGESRKHRIEIEEFPTRTKSP
jgi:hypothetical protein